MVRGWCVSNTSWCKNVPISSRYPRATPRRFHRPALFLRLRALFSSAPEAIWPLCSFLGFLGSPRLGLNTASLLIIVLNATSFVVSMYSFFIESVENRQKSSKTPKNPKNPFFSLFYKKFWKILKNFQIFANIIGNSRINYPYPHLLQKVVKKGKSGTFKSHTTPITVYYVYRFAYYLGKFFGCRAKPLFLRVWRGLGGPSGSVRVYEPGGV
jgi:hypothetical protein